MQVELKFDNGFATITFVNDTTDSVRFWEFKNSWGWFAPHFELRGENSEVVSATIVHTKKVVWTRNAPTYFTIAPGKQYEVKFDLNDGQWEIDGTLPSRDETIMARLRYTVEQTAEAAEFNVFVGTILSEWVGSQSPHNWLTNTNG